MSAFSHESETELRAAGWLPNRRVDPRAYLAGLDLSGLELHQAAERFLAEYGGLSLTPSGPGITRAKEHFKLDPRLCEGEEDRFLEWGRTINRALFPIGELDYGRFFLGIDEHAEIYTVETWIGSFGRMPVAMENLLSGVMPIDVA